jgi:hypothetical protein
LAWPPLKSGAGETLALRKYPQRRKICDGLRETWRMQRENLDGAPLELSALTLIQTAAPAA